ncbi:interleukin-31 receptor subunit alpha [Dromiciops gliroides]|uniref:interleukin-31 receptor subunit alpha n=1 Tax=Dromiciops gliroides TaxID=33562 RepID=UPI001CC3C84D|nr:interleukin-31 receptor subunit alpha [Dromiciops gliroides]
MEKMLSWALFLLLGNFCLADMPQKPENISCIFYHKMNFTCTWSPEKEVYPTVYIVNRTFVTGTKRDSCISENRTSCSFLYPYVPYPNNYSIEVEAKNVFGAQKSDVTYWDLEKIVKIEPSTILTVEPIPGVKHMLQVEWSKPGGLPYTGSYICHLRYRRVNSTNWKPVSQELQNERPYNLTGLLPLQQYAVSMRCRVATSEIWSGWSEERTGTTEGLAPNSSLDLWRVLGPAQPDGGRTVQLLWKEARVEPSVRKPLGYNIWYFPENETTVKETKTTAYQQFKIHLGSGAYLVSVVYYTSDGVSPEATLRIPAVHEKALQCIEAMQVHQSQDHLVIEWQTSAEEVDRWVIEWYPDLEMENLERSWEFVSKTRNWTGRADSFVPFQCYNISVYPVVGVVGVEVGVPQSIQAYFKEGIPLEGPLAKAQNISARTATIQWEEIPKTQRRGFINNYTVFYKSEHGREFARTLNSSTLQCELESLERNTQYTVQVMANTLVGSKNGTSFNFRTLSITTIEIVYLASITGGGLFLLGILVMVCGLTKPKLKRLVCPEIPNPAQSNVVLWHGDNFKSKLHLGEVQFHGKMKAIDERIPKPYFSSSGDLIDKLVVDFENFLDKTEVHRVELLKMKENILGGEEKYVNSPRNFYSPSGKVFQGLPSSALISLQGTQEQSSERPDKEAKGRPFQRPSAGGILEPEQQPWEEAGLNPYLKNSVTTREFLTSEKFSDPIKKTEMQP